MWAVYTAYIFAWIEFTYIYISIYTYLLQRLWFWLIKLNAVCAYDDNDVMHAAQRWTRGEDDDVGLRVYIYIGSTKYTYCPFPSYSICQLIQYSGRSVDRTRAAVDIIECRSRNTNNICLLCVISASFECIRTMLMFLVNMQIILFTLFDVRGCGLAFLSVWYFITAYIRV